MCSNKSKHTTPQNKHKKLKPGLVVLNDVWPVVMSE